jgi:3-phosphoshikimate 1-carboxyvinyltransferase
MTHSNIIGGHRLTGRCQVPGDKSISHRAVMFSALADGVSTVRNFLDGGDCRSTIDVMRGLGVKVEERTATELVIHGRGLDGLQEPAEILNCGNSGTTIRLMTGLLAGQKITTFLTGTPQIRRRPMARIVKPLRQMGAMIVGRQDGNYAPLGIGGTSLRGFCANLGRRATIPNVCWLQWARPSRSMAIPFTANAPTANSRPSISTCREISPRLHS